MESAKARWSTHWAYPAVIHSWPPPKSERGVDPNLIFEHIAFGTSMIYTAIGYRDLSRLLAAL